MKTADFLVATLWVGAIISLHTPYVEYTKSWSLPFSMFMAMSLCFCEFLALFYFMGRLDGKGK